MKLKDLVEQYGEYEVSDELIAQFKKPNPVTLWDLKNGNECYYIDAFGDIEDTGGYLSPLSEAIDMGVVFLTEEDAKKDLERRKVEALLLKHGGRRWFNSKGDNWYLVRENNDFETYKACCILPLGAIYFDTKEQAEKAIEQIGADRIKKALFEVR